MYFKKRMAMKYCDNEIGKAVQGHCSHNAPWNYFAVEKFRVDCRAYLVTAG